MAEYTQGGKRLHMCLLLQPLDRTRPRRADLLARFDRDGITHRRRLAMLGGGSNHDMVPA